MEDPSWLKVAKDYVGMKEIPGPKDNPIIVKFMKDLSHGVVADDETAWCAGFTGHCLKESGLKLPSNPLSARSYLELPVKLSKPAVGALAIFWRGSKASWQGHIGIIAGRDKAGNIMVVSGNNQNMVNISPYQWQGVGNRLLGFRWPSIAPLPERYNLPIVAATSHGGGSEA